MNMVWQLALLVTAQTPQPSGDGSIIALTWVDMPIIILYFVLVLHVSLLAYKQTTDW